MSSTVPDVPDITCPRAGEYDEESDLGVAVAYYHAIRRGALRSLFLSRISEITQSAVKERHRDVLQCVHPDRNAHRGFADLFTFVASEVNRIASQLHGELEYSSGSHAGTGSGAITSPALGRLSPSDDSAGRASPELLVRPFVRSASARCNSPPARAGAALTRRQGAVSPTIVGRAKRPHVPAMFRAARRASQCHSFSGSASGIQNDGGSTSNSGGYDAQDEPALPHTLTRSRTLHSLCEPTSPRTMLVRSMSGLAIDDGDSVARLSFGTGRRAPSPLGRISGLARSASSPHVVDDDIMVTRDTTTQF